MTIVNVNRNNHRYDITIGGHAGFNPGFDIVCSAASMLTFTLMQALKNEFDAGYMKKFEMRHASGDVHIFAVPVRECRERVEIIVDTVMLGFEMLADQYPANVQVND